MNRITLVTLFIFIFLKNSAVAEPSFKRITKKPKEDYSHSKCVDFSTKYREMLTYNEICRYGASCPSKKSQEKITMYCVEPNLSECFENKSWMTANQLVGLPDEIEIGLLTQGLSFKQGARTGWTCGYYD